MKIVKIMLLIACFMGWNSVECAYAHYLEAADPQSISGRITIPFSSFNALLPDVFKTLQTRLSSMDEFDASRVLEKLLAMETSQSLESLTEKEKIWQGLQQGGYGIQFIRRRIRELLNTGHYEPTPEFFAMFAPQNLFESLYSISIPTAQKALQSISNLASMQAAQQSQNLFQGVADAARAQYYTDLLKQYGPYVAATLIAAPLATYCAYKAYKYATPIVSRWWHGE